jgi:hypothetical protein
VHAHLAEVLAVSEGNEEAGVASVVSATCEAQHALLEWYRRHWVVIFDLWQLPPARLSCLVATDASLHNEVLDASEERDVFEETSFYKGYKALCTDRCPFMPARDQAQRLVLQHKSSADDGLTQLEAGYTLVANTGTTQQANSLTIPER